MQRLALFDLDNTLVDRGSAFARWAQEFAALWGLGPEVVEWLTEIDDDGLCPKAEFFATVRERFGLAASVEDLWAQYRRRYPEFMRCEPAVLSALSELRAAQWRVGVVTNGVHETQLGAMKHAGLTELLDGWCISEAEGLRKPDPRIFSLAAQRCGVGGPWTGWMAGDSVTADIAGGREAGLRTIWIRRGRSWPRAETAPDYEVDNALDAIKILLDRSEA
ncbi:HAD family hydrolase [Kitasatospora sp. NPDC092286]|uniref:HAD family hydrolase n=1 Tax=Kitasatospora sp. NPDC092286 TaxID=3364087 RepID=UPI0037F92246